MQNIESFTDLFSLVGCQARFYDIGRRIQILTADDVRLFDQQLQAYPHPFRQHAWLAILLDPLTQQDTLTETVIWFIRLPIDEKGGLNLGARDHFMKIIVDKILHQGGSSLLDDAMQDNPYSFQPDPERMACLHAILAFDRQQPPSRYFPALIDYLQQDDLQRDESWQQLGLQAIADLAVRCNDSVWRPYLEKILYCAPTPVTIAMAKSLEHQQLDSEYIETITQQFRKTSDIALKTALIRACSQSNDTGALQQQLQLTLLCAPRQATNDQLEIIVALVAKCPQWLATNPHLLLACLENLAEREDGYHAFAKIVEELTHTPITYKSLWSTLRSPQASERLSLAVTNLFTQTSTSLH